MCLSCDLTFTILRNQLRRLVANVPLSTDASLSKLRREHDSGRFLSFFWCRKRISTKGKERKTAPSLILTVLQKEPSKTWMNLYKNLRKPDGTIRNLKLRRGQAKVLGWLKICFGCTKFNRHIWLQNSLVSIAKLWNVSIV